MGIGAVVSSVVSIPMKGTNGPTQMNGERFFRHVL